MFLTRFASTRNEVNEAYFATIPKTWSEQRHMKSCHYIA